MISEQRSTETIDVSCIIKAPVDQVFSYVSNVNNLPRWVGPIKSVESVSGAGNVGTTAAITANIFNSDVKTSLKVTELKPNKQFSYEFSDEAYGGGFQFSFEPAFGDHTKLTMSMAVGRKNALKTHAQGLSRNLSASLETLKENVEAA
jgi:uncharacterized membrane protein